MDVKCPTCKTKFRYYSSEFRPFCTKNCKDKDLINWANEKYTISIKHSLSDLIIDDEKAEN